jgi:hypothetical protein
MGLFDIFSNSDAQAAAQAQIAGLQAGYNQASGALNSGLNSATGYYNTALSAYAPLQTTANQGYESYANALGLNGPQGVQTAQQQFQQSPGYQFQLNQGLAATDRGAAAAGSLSSGGTLAAEQNYAQGLANQTWNQYLNNLGAYNTLAPNLAGATANLNTQLGQLNYGNAQNLANLAWNAQTGQGNANANADLANYNASANFLGALMGLGTLGAKLGGFASSGGK